MQEKRFIISEEPYRIGPFEQAPIAEKDTAIVLYRREKGISNSIVIEYGRQILGSAVRKQRCDTKIIVNKAPVYTAFREKIKTEEGYCDFIVDIKIELMASDILQIVSEHRQAPCDEIEWELRSAMRGENGKHSLHRENDLRVCIMSAFNNIRMKYSYLNMAMNENIELDEYGKKLIDSERKTAVEARILRNENSLNQEKMANFQEVYQKYGDDVLLVQTTLDGDLSKRELHDILRKQRKEDRKEAAELYFQSIKEGVIDPEQAAKFTEKYVFAQTIQPVIPEKERAAIEEIVIDDTDTY